MWVFHLTASMPRMPLAHQPNNKRESTDNLASGINRAPDVRPAGEAADVALNSKVSQAFQC